MTRWCGKPSEKTPLTALACEAILKRAVKRFGADAPEGLAPVLIGDRAVGEILVDHPKSPGVCHRFEPAWAGMSVRAGQALCARRAGAWRQQCRASCARPPISTWPLRAIAFGAMGTAGQRCTTLRRLFVHESIYDALLPR